MNIVMISVNIWKVVNVEYMELKNKLVQIKFLVNLKLVILVVVVVVVVVFVVMLHAGT